jgi:hypothetical protein
LTYQAEPDRRYWFRAVATDVAGNVEADSGLAETNTRVLDYAAPVTQVDSFAFTQNDGEIIVNFSGADVGSSGLRTFQLWVSVDGGAATQVVGSPIPAGTATAGVHSGSVVYQGIRDGQSHRYRFYTRGVDARGNVEAIPTSGFDRELIRTFAPLASLAATGIDVQGGLAQRSFINQVDVLFNDASGVANLVANNRIRVERFATNASNVTPGTGTAVAGFTAVANANSIRLGFGANGIGGVKNAGDGFYRVSIDMDGNGQFDDNAHFEFFRLFGDANGNGVVNSADQALTTIDINGDGRADTRDRSDIRSALGRNVDAALLAMIDD